MDFQQLSILVLGGLVPWYPPTGGSQIVPFQLAEAMAKAGHQVDYVAVAPGGPRRDMEHARARYLSLQPGSPVFPNSLLFPLYQYHKTMSSLGDLDIVYCDAHNAAFYALHKAIFGSAPRLVATVYTSGIPRFFWQRRSFLEPYSCIAFKLADLVICPSDYSRGNVSEAYGVALSKTRALHGGVSSSFLVETPRRERKGRFTLLFCGRLNGRKPLKAVDILLKAMPDILQRHRAELKIIGTGSRFDEYAAVARTLELDEAVHFLGFIDPNEVPAHYASADLFVLPSRSENFPLVLLEAMASSLPVVATAVGGVPELVEDGETGLLVPPYDPQALAEAINSLLGDPERMRAMGEKARERVEELYTWDKVAERMAGYFREIL